MWRVGWFLRHLCESIAGTCCRLAGAVRGGGAEHLIANRAKDVETGRAVYQMVDWYKEYASKFGAVLNNNPSPGNIAGGLLNITIKSLGAIAKAGTTRVEGVLE